MSRAKPGALSVVAAVREPSHPDRSRRHRTIGSRPDSKELELEPIYALLPFIAVAVAITYTATGVSGANLWVPIYMLVLGMSPALSFWLALLTMLFGSASGLIGHWRRGSLDVRTALPYLAVGIPSAALGARLATRAPQAALLAGFGSFAVVYGALLVRRARFVRQDRATDDLGSRDQPHFLTGVVGGLFTGLISVGIGALLLPKLLRDSREGHHAHTAGSVLIVVFFASLTAALARLDRALLETLSAQRTQLFSVLAFVLPGVLIGGQIGPWLVTRIDRKTMETAVGALLVGIGLAVLGRAVGLR